MHCYVSFHFTEKMNENQIIASKQDRRRSLFSGIFLGMLIMCPVSIYLYLAGALKEYRSDSHWKDVYDDVIQMKSQRMDVFNHTNAIDDNSKLRTHNNEMDVVNHDKISISPENGLEEADHQTVEEEEKKMGEKDDITDKISLENDSNGFLRFPNSHPVCQALPSDMMTKRVHTIWKEHIQELAEHVKLIDEKATGFDESIIAMKILQTITPYIRRGLKVSPWMNDVEKILDIVMKRKENPAQNPPLKVLVLGGSVTEGRGCNVKDENGKSLISGRNCVWAQRLEHLFNGLLGFNAIEVINMASGGTGSSQGSTIIKYWMYPDSLLPYGPDVIINGYGANDSNTGIRIDNEVDRVHFLYDKAVGSLNLFNNIVRSSSCDSPVLFFLSDYIGTHRQGGVIGDMTYDMAMTQSAFWNGNLAISSADVLRHSIYADTTENSFSPEWKLRAGKYNEECHFGANTHMVIAFTFVYALLDAVISFCGDNLSSDESSKETTLLLSKEAKSLIDSQIRPPPLTFDLDLENVSNNWKNRQIIHAENCKHNINRGNPCSFGWISGPSGRTNNKRSLREFMSKYISKNNGWDYEEDMSHGWSRKLGLVALVPNAALVIDVMNTETDISKITIMSMKSYGDKWEGSLAQFTLYIEEEAEYRLLDKFEVEGFHSTTTSITEDFIFNMKEIVPKNSNFRLNVDLIGGTTFKFTGMFFCNQ